MNFCLKVFSLFIFFILIGCKENKQQIEVKKNDSSPLTNDNKIDSLKEYDINTSSEKNSFQSITLEKIEAKDAKNYIGKRVNVKGIIADVFINKKVAYLNFEHKYPRNPFTGTIFSDKIPEFGDIKKYKGKLVEVTGFITDYKGKPQIILTSTEQLKIIK